MSGRILWLDDVRPPNLTLIREWNAIRDGKGHEELNWPLPSITWAQTDEAARWYTRHFAFPFEHLFLDHDLGGDSTSMDFLKWLSKNEWPNYRFTYTIISENCVGRDNIISFMDSWHRSLEM